MFVEKNNQLGRDEPACRREAASGIEAINIIDEIRPDIIFVDIRMPL